MNASGEAVKKAIDGMKIALDKIIVVHDDMDIAFGRIKLKKTGGSAGHNGIESIINSIGSNNFIRIRVGIGKKENENGAKYVLSQFTENELCYLPDILGTVRESIECILTKGIENAMSNFNNKNIISKGDKNYE